MNELEETTKAVEVAVSAIRIGGIDAALDAGLYWMEIAAAVEVERRPSLLTEHQTGRCHRLPELSADRLRKWFASGHLDAAERAHQSGLSTHRHVLAHAAIGALAPARHPHHAMLCGALESTLRVRAEVLTPEEATAERLRLLHTATGGWLSVADLTGLGIKLGFQHREVDAGHLIRVITGGRVRYRAVAGGRLDGHRSPATGPVDLGRKITIKVDDAGLVVYEGGEVVFSALGRVLVSMKIDN